MLGKGGIRRCTSSYLSVCVVVDCANRSLSVGTLNNVAYPGYSRGMRMEFWFVENACDHYSRHQV